jgi:hypothetical protein
MSFNYLQTDDRDSYFESLGKKKKEKVGYTHYTVLDNENNIIVEGKSLYCFLQLRKSIGLTARFGKKAKWREEVVRLGYILKEELKKY